ncbi:oocyte zinc finger protein XlCOF28-like [Anopheles maculipalpis]|uniref:oocyte zinc finger protein XlCOF28-like n=1 Tax=Anopheles maculipalpis TaxID=1496333 RepID=UPI002159B012|nr:oocyte zinc finger protein XlCOF28-like [Anopheles maculipalpis]
MENDNMIVYAMKKEVIDHPDDYEQKEHNALERSSQDLASQATRFQVTKVECSSGSNFAGIQIKVESHESSYSLLHEKTEHESRDTDDDTLAAQETCSTSTKMEYPYGDDIVLEATKITPAYGTDAVEQIKVEPDDASIQQDTPGPVLEPYESTPSQGQEIKIENVSLQQEEHHPVPVDKASDPKVDDQGETPNDSSADQYKRVETNGVLYEIRVVNEGFEKEDKNVTIDQQQPSSSKPVTDVMSSIKLLGENKQYKCDRCEKSFCDKMELKIHKRNHQFTVCPVCKRTMRTDFVKRHIARVHPDDGILPRNQSLPCDECDRVFSNDVQLKNHQLSHKKQACPVCGKIVRSDYLKRHMDLNHPKEVNAVDGTTYQCDQCDTVLSNKNLLFFHKRTHQTEECPVCKETLRAGYMKIHIDMKHPDHSTLPENPAFKCEQCEKTFGYKAALTLHKRKHRLTECPVCKKTVRSDCLKRHMDFNHPSEVSLPEQFPSADGRSPSQLVNDRRAPQTEDCPECKETFRSDYLKIHIAMKHPNDSALPEDRPFRCDQCGKSFCYKTQLRLHKRNHRLAECTVCRKSMRMDCLKLHMSRMHPNVASSVGTQH